MPEDNFPDISLDRPSLSEETDEEETAEEPETPEEPEEPPPPGTQRTGYKGKKINRMKAQRIFHDNLPLAAQTIVDILKKKSSKSNPMSADDMKLLVMQKDAAETIMAYGMGRPGTQPAPKVNEKKIPLIELDLGDIATLKKENAGSPQEDNAL